ncbi:hypothetical protein QQX98_013263, partial [Neonectria punicea]
MLSVESGDDDILYRIQRRDRRVVYVTVLRPEIIPTEKRTYGPSVMDELSKLEVWNDNDWITLRVDKDSSDGRIRCIKDFREAHSVPKEYLLDHYLTYDISNLPPIRHTKSRTWEVSLNGQPSFLKIARFPHELKWIIQEIRAYHAVAESSVTPRLLGYVCESLTQERIIGILIEKVDGRCAELDDLDRCRDALDKLHRHLVHGDL